MQHYCQCGERLKAVKSNRTGTRTAVMYKTFHVVTTTVYKCPSGCDLKQVKTYR